jgi:hypothetical protein
MVTDMDQKPSGCPQQIEQNETDGRLVEILLQGYPFHLVATASAGDGPKWQTHRYRDMRVWRALDKPPIRRYPHPLDRMARYNLYNVDQPELSGESSVA